MCQRKSASGTGGRRPHQAADPDLAHDVARERARGSHHRQFLYAVNQAPPLFFFTVATLASLEVGRNSGHLPLGQKTFYIVLEPLRAEVLRRPDRPLP